MREKLQKLRERCGEFWWWSMLIFLACRSGDVIQAFVGLWLVPKYVGTEELGAALPLMQAGSAVGLPLAVLVIPFSRWLTLYAANGERGKIKRLLQIAFIGVAAAFVFAAIVAKFALPLFFERLRIAEGSLGVLIICAGMVGPFSTVFTNALQGLKRFGAMTVMNFLGSPLRLVVLLVAMPFRALSGYMLGQISAPAMNIAIAWAALRRDLGGAVRSVALGREDVRAMFRYAAPVAVYVVVGTLLSTWQSLLFRQRLPEVESAAYYMLSRLAETAAYAGVSLSVVVFPFAAEESGSQTVQESGGVGQNRDSGRLLHKLLLGALIPGLAITAAFFVFGRYIFNLVPLWRPYSAYSALLALCTLRIAIAATASAFFTFEVAAGRFGFLWYWVPLSLVETGGLVALTGYGAFCGILPAAMVDWMASLRAARLEFFIYWLTAAMGLICAFAFAHIIIRSRRNGKL